MSPNVYLHGNHKVRLFARKASDPLLPWSEKKTPSGKKLPPFVAADYSVIRNALDAGFAPGQGINILGSAAYPSGLAALIAPDRGLSSWAASHFEYLYYGQVDRLRRANIGFIPDDNVVRTYLVWFHVARAVAAEKYGTKCQPNGRGVAIQSYDPKDRSKKGPVVDRVSRLAS